MADSDSEDLELDDVFFELEAAEVLADPARQAAGRGMLPLMPVGSGSHAIVYGHDVHQKPSRACRVASIQMHRRLGHLDRLSL